MPTRSLTDKVELSVVNWIVVFIEVTAPSQAIILLVVSDHMLDFATATPTEVSVFGAFSWKISVDPTPFTNTL
jgi:hypothetical protein|tara:strand:+ start:1991 stop:2209 length:219 start_codon:yes stop_codon:yes gene_type:complete